MAIVGTHIGQFFYQAEASYGGGFAAGAQHLPSDSVTSATMTPAMNPVRLRNINNNTAVDTTQGAHDYTVNLEYFLQDISGTHTLALSLEYWAITRAAGDLQSLCGALMTKPATGVYFVLTGGKINTATYTFTVGQPIKVAMEIWFSNLTTATAAPTGTAPSALATVFDTFNGATVTRSGKWAAGIKSGTLTINNNLERIPKLKGATAQGGDYAIIMPGIQEYKFTGEIIADAGGKSDIDDILSDPETSIVIASRVGDANGYKWTLTKPNFNSEPVVYTADMTTLIINADIGAETIALASS